MPRPVGHGGAFERFSFFEFSAGNLGAAQVGLTDVSFVEAGAAQVCAGDVGFAQIALGEIGSV